MSHHPEKTSRIPGVIGLLLSTGVVAVLWLVALPWYANRPAMNDHLHWLESRGIDPSAMYYTELDAMKPILDRLNRQQRAQLPETLPRDVE